MKFKYPEMITDAILTLGERKGSSREAIWKYVQTQYPEDINQKKFFLVSLKRISDIGEMVKKSENNQQRYRLDPNFRDKYIKHLAKGTPFHLAQKHAMTTKTKNDRKPVSKMNKAKLSKTAKGKASLKKKVDSKQKKIRQMKNSKSKMAKSKNIS